MSSPRGVLFDKARQALASASLLLEHGDADAAVSRAYYAAYYAATALLTEAGEAPKSHAGTHRRFYALFVQTGRISPDVAALLKYAYNVRQRVDYEAFATTDPASAADLVRDAAHFVSALEALAPPP